MNEKINLQKKSDILKYSYSQLKNTKLHNFQGDYFKEIFAEAIKLEKEEKDEIIVEYIEIEMHYHIEFGQKVVLCGNQIDLGSWNAKKGYNIIVNFSFNMIWKTGDIWTTKIPFNPNFEFKFAVLENENLKKWETCENRIFDFKAIKETFLKTNKPKSIIVTNMKVSYNYVSKIMNVECSWK